MLFCDVTGSTAAAERLDPEEWAEIMNGAFEHLISPIYRYEGTLARLMGDAILAFFGAPIAHEDDPQRAVLAGLDIVQGIRAYQAEIKSRWDLDFGVRVGINTGLVIVGEVGSDLRVEYTAMGDAINLAARMEQTAPTGTVQVAADTHNLMAPLFDFESLGGIEVKGKSEPVPAYRVIGPKTVPGRLRGLEGLVSPLVGRDSDIRELRRVLENLQDGRGGLVCLIGEAGIGKTSVLNEAKAQWESIAGKDAPWIEGRGVSYDTSVRAVHATDLPGIWDRRQRFPRISTREDRYNAGGLSTSGPDHNLHCCGDVVGFKDRCGWPASAR
jgi:class 3 adenylate cyclase